MKKLKKIYELVCFTEEMLNGVFLVAIMALIFASGFARSVGNPLSWSMDAATFLFAWVVFFITIVSFSRALNGFQPAGLCHSMSNVPYFLSTGLGIFHSPLMISGPGR